MKYIIDIPADTEWVEICKIIDSAWHGTMRMALSDLTPYDPEFQSDLLEDIRKQIEDEVWDTAIKISIADNGWSWQEMTYQEAKAKFEAWKKEKDEIHVGDEVYSRTSKWRGIVTDIDDGDLTIMDSSGETACHYNPKHFGKTGKHFNSIKNLLEGLKEDSE